ncbi:acyltransferase [Paenibacillus oryzisoli]|uniref:acyltransferase n=1 Tax=Paenibacillus oryzisoli TaxID=1850517 RepID=UPI003D2738DA
MDNNFDKFPDVSFGNMVQLIGMKGIEIENGSCIGDNAWLNVCVRDEKVRLKIGRCVLIGRQSLISTGGYLEIGDYCLLAPRVYISDADHVFEDIYTPIIQQGVTLNRSVIVEDNCWIGINVVITGDIVVGRGSIIAANSVVNKSVPPFSLVAGNPFKIIKMYNPKNQTWERVRSEAEIQNVFKDREEVGLPTREEYKKILNENSRIRRLDPILAGNGINI